MNRLLSYHNRLMAATCLISISLIGYQVAIIQLLSYVQWHHYANMVISVALLGFGAAGTFLSLFGNRLYDRSERVLPVFMILAGLAMVVSIWLLRSGLARFDSYLLFVERRQWLRLLANCLFFFIPFFFGALPLGIIFVKYVGNISYFYFSNLTGSAIGAVLAAALSWYFFPAVLPVVSSTIAILSAIVILPVKRRLYIFLLAIASFAFAIYRIIEPVDLRLSEYKSLQRTLNLPAARIDIEKSGPYGFVQVVSADALRYAPGLSLAFTGEIPVRKAVFNNGDWFGAVLSSNKKDGFHLLDFTTMGLPYQLRNPEKVLVLHAGTGMHTSHALRNGAILIDAVEPHKTINSLLLNELAPDTDSLLYDAAITLHETEPRTYLSATNHKYDLIHMPVIGAFGGGVGLFSMREEYTLTKKAFSQMMNVLEDDGAICITTWMDYPFRNSLKVVATLAETAEDFGLTPIDSHLVAVRSWGTTTFLLRKSPVTSSDIANIREFCSKLYFDPVFLPGLLPAERTEFNDINDTSFFSYMDELISPRRENLYREYDFHLRPATDDKPYFSQFLRWRSLRHLASTYGSQSAPFLELGWLISAITFLQLSLLAVLLIIGPLVKIGWRSSNRLRTFVYFSGIGIGYMFFEIILMQHFFLFFGNPVYAAAFVISVMLFASGAGSFLSSRMRLSGEVIQKILLAVAGLMVIYFLFLSTFLQTISGTSAALKIIVSLIVIALPALLMGMPFPLGLKWLSRGDENSMAWAWAINGCMSVISAALAGILAVEFGLSMMMICAAAAYATSWLAVYKQR